MNKNDYELLNEVTTLWGVVQRENFLDRELVTDEEWRQWRKFDELVSERLNSIIDGFYENLSAEAVAYLKGLKGQVATAKRLKTEELLSRKVASEMTKKLRQNLFETELREDA